MKQFFFTIVQIIVCMIFSTALCAESDLVLLSADFTPEIFQMGGPGIDFVVGSYELQENAEKYNGFGAPVKLLDGAVVAGMNCYMINTSNKKISSLNSKYYLWRQQISATEFDEATPMVGDPTSATSTPIDNSQYSYGAYVLLKISAGDERNDKLQFNGCKITYK